MDRNYGNLENLLPLLGAITNGNSMNSNQNFINQLAAAISSAVGASNSATNAQGRLSANGNNAVSSRVRQQTPEPPPPPRFRANSPIRMKPNRGTAPMDIENESERSPVDNVVSQQPPTTNTNVGNMANENIAAGMSGTNMFPNGFMSQNVSQTGGFNAQQAARMNAPQSGGFNSQQYGGFNAQQAGGINVTQPGGFNAQQSSGYNAQQAGVMNAQQSGGINAPQLSGMNTPQTGGMTAMTVGSMNVPPPSYMYFPAAAAANAASTSAAAAATHAANQMFMDPTTMLAAMQHMQQNYAANMTTTLTNGQDLVAIIAAASATPGIKGIIRTKNCILLPPAPSAPPPTTRDRPPGCRTVFVGGLPENTTEEQIREVFEPCGEITILRASKKNFCHIRYRIEESVERALYFSGYRMRIPSKTNDAANIGRLHVDYAQARDDLYDFECKQRQLQREQRHRKHTTIDSRRSASPPPISQYNEAEAAVVAEQLRSSETFIRAVQKIAVWLERGDCKKSNANMFYSMIQSTHSHVRRLHTDKQQMEDELRKARESFRKEMLTMSSQFAQIEKVFNAASHKKVWDHFSKAQRKNIDQWKKLALELRSVQIEDDEMEMSDDDRNQQSSNAKRMRYDAESLKEENDSLRCQLEALRSEISHDRTDTKYDTDYREKQIKVLQETIRNMQTQLLQTKMREQKDNKIIQTLQRNLKEANVKQLLLKTKIKETTRKRRERETSSERSERSDYSDDDVEEVKISEDQSDNTTSYTNKEREMNANIPRRYNNNLQIIDIDDDVIIEDQNCEVVEIHDEEDVEEKTATNDNTENGEQGDHEQQNEYGPELNQTVYNDVEAKLSEEKVSDEKACMAEVETKLMEEPYELEPKFLPFVEAKIIALTAAYLIIQPFGIKTESICDYLQQSMDTLDLQSTTLEQILGTYTNIFKLESEEKNGVDNETKALWKFCGFTASNDEPMENGKVDVNKVDKKE